MVTTANTPTLRRSLLGAETAPLRARHPRTQQPVLDKAAVAEQTDDRSSQSTGGRRARLEALRAIVRVALDD